MGKNVLKPKIEENELPVDEEVAEPVNETEEKEAPKEEQEEKSQKRKPTRNSFKDFLDGNILRRKAVLRSIPLILLVLLMLIFIVAVRYKIEQTSKRIEDLKKELKILKVKQIETKLEYMHAATLTEIAKALDSTGIEQSIDRPHKIVLKEDTQSSE